MGDVGRLEGVAELVGDGSPRVMAWALDRPGGLGSPESVLSGQPVLSREGCAPDPGRRWRNPLYKLLCLRKTARVAEADEKQTLHRYLRNVRGVLLWKLEGLSDYDIRRPMTPTGTNLLGLVKHCAGV